MFNYFLPPFLVKLYVAEPFIQQNLELITEIYVTVDLSAIAVNYDQHDHFLLQNKQNYNSFTDSVKQVDDQQLNPTLSLKH